jgi:hypothetical protein
VTEDQARSVRTAGPATTRLRFRLRPGGSPSILPSSRKLLRKTSEEARAHSRQHRQAARLARQAGTGWKSSVDSTAGALRTLAG